MRRRCHGRRRSTSSSSASRCFLFAAGFTLARERRPRGEAVLIAALAGLPASAVSAALLMTAIGIAFGPASAPSNYLPFVAGANVVFNNFPANPTTWYLGTYVHALLLWAVAFSGRRVGLGVLAVALVIEIGARVALQEVAGSYVAYMLLTNWLGPFIAGLFMGARPTTERAGFAPGYVIALAVILVTISLSMGAMQPAKGFPFMTPSGGSIAGLFGFSVVISTLYLATAFLMFKGFERAPAPAAIRYLARNSLIIVLLHMPLYFALNPVLMRNGWSYTARVVLELIVVPAGTGVALGNHHQRRVAESDGQPAVRVHADTRANRMTGWTLPRRRQKSSPGAARWSSNSHEPWFCCRSALKTACAYFSCVADEVARQLLWVRPGTGVPASHSMSQTNKSIRSSLALLRWLTATVAVVLLGGLGHVYVPAEAQSSGGADNPIVCENGKAGDPASDWDISGAGDPSIQGFATNISVAPGDVQQFKIDTPSTNYPSTSTAWATTAAWARARSRTASRRRRHCRRSSRTA